MAKKRRRRGTPRALPVRVVEREDWGQALEVGGVTQSVTTPDEAQPDDDSAADGKPHPGPHGGYWGLMLPPGHPRRALLLGLGGGTVATLLARRCPQTDIVGVERDTSVLALARAEFGLDALPRLTIVEADAFTWMEALVGEPSTADLPADARFDLICVDLFEAGRLAAGTLATRFLRQVAALLAPGGVVTINLMVTGRTPEQIHRLQRVYSIERQLRTRGNVILHLRPLAPGAEHADD